jgi:hypothetical protein
MRYELAYIGGILAMVGGFVLWLSIGTYETLGDSRLFIASVLTMVGGLGVFAFCLRPSVFYDIFRSSTAKATSHRGQKPARTEKVKCPRCFSSTKKIIKTDLIDGQDVTSARMRCGHCGHETSEVLESNPAEIAQPAESAEIHSAGTLGATDTSSRSSGSSVQAILAALLLILGIGLRFGAFMGEMNEKEKEREQAHRQIIEAQMDRARQDVIKSREEYKELKKKDPADLTDVERAQVKWHKATEDPEIRKIYDKLLGIPEERSLTQGLTNPPRPSDSAEQHQSQKMTHGHLPGWADATILIFAVSI